MARILLLVPTSTYRARDFLAAAGRLGVEVVVGMEAAPALGGSGEKGTVEIPLDDPEAAVGVISELHARRPFDGVVAVDDQGAEVAARAGARLGIRHNRPDAVRATRDKSEMRRRLAAGGVDQPVFSVLAPGGDAEEAAAAGSALGYPCVLKPVSRSGSQGVIRVNDPEEARRAFGRIRDIVGTGEPLVIESYVPGEEVAVEGLLDRGRLDVLAVFDKPDPLEGPFFEETIYVTPSRQPREVLARVHQVMARAAAALGLEEGPVHAEARIGPKGEVTVLEVAARTIGGLCARTLRFGAGVPLEELVIAHALGRGTSDLVREEQASGVMMLPIPEAGVLEEVAGQEEARVVQGVTGLELTISSGRPLVPLPEGDRYLGFLFARGATPDEVEDALRQAAAHLVVRVRPPSSGEVGPEMCRPDRGTPGEESRVGR